MKENIYTPIPIQSSKQQYPFDVVDPYHVVQFLFQLHYQRGISPPRSFNTYLKECKKLMKEIPLPQIIEALSSINSERPFGFALVRKVINAKNSQKKY